MALVEAVVDIVPSHLDGQTCIAEMKDRESRNWRQSEWPGFYIEELLLERLGPRLGVKAGPQVLNTTFDAELGRVFDIKTHDELSGTDVILNAADATDAVLARFGALGFLIVNGVAERDDDWSFYEWHEAQKGTGKRQGGRYRKRAFTPTRVDFFLFSSVRVLRSAVETGFMMQTPQGRQASGATRKDKYRMNLAKPVPAEVLHLSRSL